MSGGMGLRDLVIDLEDSGFKLGLTPDKRTIEITKPEELGVTVIASVNVTVPSYIMVSDDIKKMDGQTVRQLLPPIFNYVLSYLASTEIELSELTSGKDRNQIVRDIVTEDSNYIRQGMIDTLINSDKLMLLADVYGEIVCRKIDLLSAIRELGYQESTVTGRELNIKYQGYHIATLNLDASHKVRRELDWDMFPEERRNELTLLLKWYVETPKKFRNLSFSLLEQVLISNLPRQYKWAYRDEDNTLWAVDDFNNVEKARKEIICDVSLYKMITKDNPFPTHLGRVN